tara:strand:+ start:4889 stop:5152 length:264 start_codon:yes stop_codon:yes gene_type:complete
MVKNLLLILSLIFVGLFNYFVVNSYFSDKNKKKINQNRSNYNEILNNKKIQIPYLKNDTDNVIEFNSGYTNKQTNENRSFWELFKNE